MVHMTQTLKLTMLNLYPLALIPDPFWWTCAMKGTNMKYRQQGIYLHNAVSAKVTTFIVHNTVCVKVARITTAVCKYFQRLAEQKVTYFTLSTYLMEPMGVLDILGTFSQ